MSKKIQNMDKRLQVMVTADMFDQLKKEAEKLSKEFGIKVDISKVIRRLLSTHPDLK